MSVPKSNRKEARLAFITNARILQNVSVKHCIRLPKRYYLTHSYFLLEVANDIANDVVRANAIFPMTRADFDYRRMYLQRALGNCYVLSNKVDNLYVLNPKKPSTQKDSLDSNQRIKPLFSPYAFQEWFGLIDKEIKLIKGVMTSDKKKFNKLYQEAKDAFVLPRDPNLHKETRTLMNNEHLMRRST